MAAQRSLTDPAIDGSAHAVTPPSFEAPAFALDEEPDVPRRGFAIGLGVAALAVVLGGATWWIVTRSHAVADETDPEIGAAEVAPSNGDPPMSRSAAPVDKCRELEPLAGQWELTTEVVTSSNPAQLGIHGYFTLFVDVEGCEATATLTKTGYTGRWYDDAHVQRGKAKLEPGPHFGFAAAFDLRDASGRGGGQEMVFTVHEHRLTGTYRMPGRTGFLEGARDPGRRLLPTLDAQPCIARCAVACDLMRRDLQEAAIRDVFERCTTTCETSNAPTCGDVRPLPEAWGVPVSGPAETLAGACNELGRSGCRTDLKVKKKPAQSWTSDRPDTLWRATQFAIAGGKIHVGLRTASGWFAAGPILDLEGAELSRARIVVRDLGSSKNDRYVVGDVEAAGRVATFACRVEGDAPRCVAVPAAASAVNPLPGATLAIADGSEGLEAGLFAW